MLQHVRVEMAQPAVIRPVAPPERAEAFHAFADALPVGLAWVDDAGSVIEHNRLAEELLAQPFGPSLQQGIHTALAEARGRNGCVETCVEVSHSEKIVVTVAPDRGATGWIVSFDRRRLERAKAEASVLRAVIQAMAAIGALQSLSQLAYPLTMALGQTKLLFRRDVMLLIIRLAGLVTGGLLYGLPGVIGGSVLTVSIMIVINAFLVKELTGLPILKQFGANRRTLVAVSAMAAAVLLIRSASYSDFSPIQLILALVAEVALGAVVYLGTLVALWKIEGSPTGPESEVFDMARKVWRRLKKS